MISRRNLRRLSTPLFAVLLLVLVGSYAVACPTCKDSLAENDPNNATLVRGYFWSILFMMSMPFLILAGLSSYMYYEVRRARARLVSVPAESHAGIEKQLSAVEA